MVCPESLDTLQQMRASLIHLEEEMTKYDNIDLPGNIFQKIPDGWKEDIKRFSVASVDSVDTEAQLTGMETGFYYIIKEIRYFASGTGNITNSMNFTNTNLSTWNNNSVFYWNNTGLSSGTLYDYRIYAYNSSGTGSLNLTYATISNTTLIIYNAPNITSWGNDNTSNANITLSVQKNTNITFNVTINQSATTTWTGTASPTKINGTDSTESYAFKNFTSAGTFTVIASCSNTNGSCLNSITWTVTAEGDGITIKNPFVAVGIAAMGIAGAIAWYTWRRRRTGSNPFMFFNYFMRL